MSTQTLKIKVAEILALADISINGADPWDIQIHDEKFYQRVLSEGSLGLGESYLEGWWDCDRLDEFIFRVLRADLYKHAKLGWKVMIEMLSHKIINMQVKRKAARNAQVIMILATGFTS